MEIRFLISDMDILRSPYYNDFFFEKIKIYVKTNKKEKINLFHSAVHGKFLLSLGDAIIQLIKTGKSQSITSIGEPHTYNISLHTDEIIIESNVNQEIIQTYIFSKEDFLNALVNESKYYLQKIKRLNPRIVLEDQYQLLSSCFVYFDNFTIFHFSSQNL